MKKISKVMAISLFGIGLTLLVSVVTFASSTTGLPFETPFQTIRESLSGPVAYSVAFIAIIGTGIGAFFGQSEGFFHKLMQVGFVLSFIFGATTLINVLFPGASGLGF